MGDVYTRSAAPGLRDLRRDVFKTSTQLAALRIKTQKSVLTSPQGLLAQHRANTQLWAALAPALTVGNVAGMGRDTNTTSLRMPFTAVGASPNSRVVVTAAEDHALCVWNPEDGTVSHRVLGCHRSRVNHVSVSAAAERGCDAEILVATASNDQSAHIARVQRVTDGTFRLHSVARCLGHEGRVLRSAWSPTHPNRILLTTGDDGTLRMWDPGLARAAAVSTAVRNDVSAPCAVATWGHHTAHATEVRALSFHPDGALVGTGDDSGLWALWDLRQGKRAALAAPCQWSAVTCMSFNFNGVAVAVGGRDGVTNIYDLRRVVTQKDVSSATDNGSGKATGGHQRTLFSVAAHSDSVTELRYCPMPRPADDEASSSGTVADSACLITAGLDGAVALWDAWTGALMMRLRLFERSVRSFAFVGGGAGGDAETGLPDVVVVGHDAYWKLLRIDTSLIGRTDNDAVAAPTTAVGGNAISSSSPPEALARVTSLSASSRAARVVTSAAAVHESVTSAAQLPHATAASAVGDITKRGRAADGSAVAADDEDEDDVMALLRGPRRA